MNTRKDDHDSKSEFARIDDIAARVGAPGPRTLIGIGDDTAVVKTDPESSLLLCTDAMVEGVHFDFWWITPKDLGYKALAAGMSDIAAMNGRPLHALFSIALPKTAPPAFLEDFYEGAKELAQEIGCDIVGGDLTFSPGPIFIDVTCIGEAKNPIPRSGARVGDLVAISGHPGSSAAGLYVLQNEIDGFEALISAHNRPRPRFDLLPGFQKTDSLCTSMIDVSDGLSSELHHLAKRSRVGFEIQETLVPLAPDTARLAEQAGKNALDWALSGGEDYELLVTLDEANVTNEGGPPPGFTIIGRVVAPDQGLTLLRPDGSKVELEATGFNHFIPRK